jgi:membrane protein implicated in regulation of membrane protease activity
MSPLLVIRLFSFWQMQLVVVAVFLLLPLVSYLAAVQRRGRRRSRFVPPAEKVGE